MLIHTRFLVLIIVTGLFLSSCSNRFSLEKRRYNKGYHLSHARAQPAKKQSAPRDMNPTMEARLPESMVSARHTIVETPLAQNGLVENNQAKITGLKKTVKALPVVLPENTAKAFFRQQNPSGSARALAPPASAVPYGNWGGNILFQVLAYVAGTIISILLVILVFIVFDAIVSGTLAGLFIWLGPVLLFLLVIGAVAAGLVILYNSD